MAFVCELSEGDDVHAEVFRRGSEWLVLIHIGHDLELCVRYSVLIGLSPVPGTGDLEYFFTVVEAGLNDLSEHQYWSGQDTKFLVGHRKLVLAAILRATESLVKAAQPAKIIVTEHDENPPPKARNKYLLVARVIETCGYRVNKPDTFHGRCLWWMERNP